jgi:site-specific recombinase XerD
MRSRPAPTRPRRSPANKGRRYPADPPRIEEIIAVMRQAGERPYGLRVRDLIVVLWRAGLRIAEALALTETDLDPGQGSVLIRSGKGRRRRVVGMDNWGWEQLRPWLEYRQRLPVGPVFSDTRGRAWHWPPASIPRWSQNGSATPR